MKVKILDSVPPNAKYGDASDPQALLPGMIFESGDVPDWMIQSWLQQGWATVISL